MSEIYSKIDFDKFLEEPKEMLTKTEEKRLRKKFNQSVYDYKKIKGKRKIAAAVAACLIVCLIATPLGSSVWAAVKEVCQGIGEYMGMDEEDNYAMQIGQTQAKGDVIVTLNEVVISDIQLRCSITAESKSKKPVVADVSSVFINGKEVGKDILSGGYGSFGSTKNGNKRTYYRGVDAYMKMPDKPKIKMVIACGNEFFDYEFMLDNRKFKEHTRTADINKTIEYKGKRLILKQLSVTPIDHTIWFENPDNQDCVDLPLHGTDNLGNEVTFSSLSQINAYLGNRDNEDGKTYELNSDVSSYSLRMYDLNNADPNDLWNEKNAICDAFTVDVK